MTWAKFLRMCAWVLLAGASRAWAFPESIRDKYNNCISCHVSPTGGGLLTPYGRGVAPEVFSTWGGESEGEFLNDKVKLPAWLLVGGDFRVIQTYMNSPTAKQGRFFLMQADLQLAATFGMWTVEASGGREDVKVGNKGDKGEFVSRSHYVLVNPAETYYLRAGKFQKSFGINTPEHVTSTKRGLGFDENTESYNVEASRLTESTNLIVTAVGGRPDDHTIDAEKGVAVNGSVFLADRYKLGASAYQAYRSRSSSSRRVVGPWLLAGITKQFFVEAEADYVTTYANRGTSGHAVHGFAVYAKEEYALVRGFNVYLVQDLAKRDLAHHQLDQQGYGPGLNWQPRPHFEFQAEYQKQKILAISSTAWQDWAYLFVHYYL